MTRRRGRKNARPPRPNLSDLGHRSVRHLLATESTCLLAADAELKKKYGAEWAVVTGSSSGIGKSLAIKLAQQGVNVVLVALQENLLDDTFAELQQQFKERKFIKVGVNLGTPGYLDKIAEATKDVDVQLVFNNAGFMLTGFFDKQYV